MKHKINFAISFLVLLLLTGNILSQENIFTVVAANKNVTIKSAASNKLLSASPGLKLGSEDEIQVNENGYIGLADSSLSTIELKKAGSYKAISLLNEFGSQNHSLTKKFMNFVIDEMAEKSKKTKEMRTLGAVVRLGENRIDVNLPQNISLFDSVFTFRWYPARITEQYIFQLLNPSNKTIFMKEISDTSLTLEFSELNLQENKSYKWLIFDSGNSIVTSDSVKFYVLSKLERKNIADELSSFNLKFGESSSAIDHLVFASYLKEKGLYLRAIEEYKKVIEIAPNVNEYWTNYLQFLLDVGLKKQALDGWAQSVFIKQN